MNKEIQTQAQYEKSCSAINEIRLGLKEKKITVEEALKKMTSKKFRYSNFRAKQLINTWKENKFENINPRRENKRSVIQKVITGKGKVMFSDFLSEDAKQRFSKLHPQMTLEEEMV